MGNTTPSAAELTKHENNNSGEHNIKDPGEHQEDSGEQVIAEFTQQEHENSGEHEIQDPGEHKEDSGEHNIKQRKRFWETQGSML